MVDIANQTLGLYGDISTDDQDRALKESLLKMQREDSYLG